MSGRKQALMHTRCPACGTVFRVTSEQLRLKAGTVRCGHCRSVFNAFDGLVSDEPVIAAPPPAALPESGGDAQSWPTIIFDDVAEPAAAPPAAPVEEKRHRPARKEQAPAAAASLSPHAEADAELESVVAAASQKLAAVAESIEQSTLAAREAGLVAARELAEAPDYNRWAAGAMVGDASVFGAEPARRALWPFVIVALLLALLLAAQLLLHFRTEVARWLPATAAYYEMVGMPAPLSRNAERVVIDTSDLQADKPRGLFVLQTVLRNQAPYPQDWPALELTLTDAADHVVARRVMQAAEYLPPAISPELFPANGEVAVRLWIEARELNAAGYRLYVFYP